MSNDAFQVGLVWNPFSKTTCKCPERFRGKTQSLQDEYEVVNTHLSCCFLNVVLQVYFIKLNRFRVGSHIFVV